MKRIITIILSLLLCSLSFAQPTQRSTQTIIVDALNQLPAQDNALLVRLMDDIASTGEVGTTQLLNMLERNDASRVKVEYALNGLAAYISRPEADPAERERLLGQFQAAFDAIEGNSEQQITDKEFLRRQIIILGGQTDLGDAVSGAGVGIVKPIWNVKAFTKAIKSKDRETRFAALYTADAAEAVAEAYEIVNKTLPKAKADAQVDYLYWMSTHPEMGNAAVAASMLNSKDKAVVAAAAELLTAIGDDSYIPELLDLLNNADNVALVESSLRSYKGDVCYPLSSLWADSSSSEIKAMIVRIIAARQAKNYKRIVWSALKQEEVVRAEGFKALKAVCTPKDTERLFNLLENSKQTYIADIQSAITKVLKEQDNAFEALSARKDAAGVEKSSLYWPMIIDNASMAQLFEICKDFASQNADVELRDAAFAALLESTRSVATGEQRLLKLRDAFELARNTEDKNLILKEIISTGSFLGLIFAGQYIDCPELAQQAAQAVKDIALSHIEYNGAEVVELLKKAAKVIDNPDAQYEIIAINQHLEKLAAQNQGFVSLFNGNDLSGWKGLLNRPYDNPYERAKLSPKALEKAQKAADEAMSQDWKVEDGCIVFNGSGYNNLCTVKQYGNFELYLDWKLFEGSEPDAGVYLRGAPQVQIWDTARTNVGAEVGSGGLYNNKQAKSTPSCVADNAVGEWNSFYIKMIDERVSVWLNGVQVVDNVVMENYWDRTQPIFPMEQIELQAHGSKVAFRDIYIKELPSTPVTALSAQEKKEGFKMLFDGTSLNEWQGNKLDYQTSEGTIHVLPTGQGFGNLYTREEYSDFIFRFEFKLTPGANNGVGIRAEMGKDAAYYGMEIQVLDHYDAIYQPGLMDYQYHGSVYGIIPTHNRDMHKPLGEWNEEEIYVKGDYIRVTLNGVVITEGNIREATKNGTYDHKEHPGLFNKSGYIGFLGHGSELWFRNVRVKRIK